MKPYLCLLPGIHDVVGNRRHGELVIADDAMSALEYAAYCYGLHAAPDGSSAIVVAHPTLGRDA